MLNRAEDLYRRIVLRDHVAFVSRAARSMAAAGPMSILDVGCGNATFLSLLKVQGFKVAGVDTSGAAADIAARAYGVNVHVGRVEDLDLPEGTYDVVTMFHVIEHLREPRSSLSMVRRLLKREGRLIVQVPNTGGLQRRIFGAGWYGLDVPRHVINYSVTGLCRLLGECGFEVVRTSQFCLRDNAPAMVSSVFLKLDPAHRQALANMRKMTEGETAAWLKHSLYLFLVGCATPLAMVESALGLGATVMAEAKKRP